MTTRHAKYPAPPIVEAPPELEALVAAHVASTGREWGITRGAIRAWFVQNRILKWTVFITEHYVVSCRYDVPKIGNRSEPLPIEGGSGSH